VMCGVGLSRLRDVEVNFVRENRGGLGVAAFLPDSCLDTRFRLTSTATFPGNLSTITTPY